MVVGYVVYQGECYGGKEEDVEGDRQEAERRVFHTARQINKIDDTLFLKKNYVQNRCRVLFQLTRRFKVTISTMSYFNL